MLFSHAHKRTSRRHRGWLYSVVFASRISTMVICFLFFSFLIQPFHKAFASEPLIEVVPEPEVAVAQDVLTQEDTEPTPEESPPDEPVMLEEVEPSVLDTEESLSLQEDDVTNVVASTTDDNPTQIEDTETKEEVTPLDTDSDNGDAAPDVESLDTDSSDEQAPKEISQEEVATSTETVIQAQYLVTEENYYQFSKQSCVAVGSGAFHCTRGGQNEIDSQSVVYSDIGPSGNMEIFLKTTTGKVKQLTDNMYDDTAPFYDAESMRVVWQRLIDGRQQIILFDIQDNEEAQLTFSRSNNMEPKVSAAGIVWQAWDEHDWEVMYFDGTFTDQITQNDGHDVAPVIKDNYILWSVLGGENQQARVYSLDTKETISIVGHEGGSIENPRFVLVYDTKFDNGDVVTQGFDPVTGLSKAIAAQPVQEPVDIPSSDTTGETRALIQNKSSQKDEKDFSNLNTDPNIDPSSSASSTDPAVLDLTSSEELSALNLNSQAIESFELTEYDLVLPLTDETASSTQ